MKKKGFWTFAIFSGTFSIVGLFALGYSVMMTVDNIKLKANGEIITGYVSGIIVSHSSDGTSYKPEISFQHNNQWQSFRHDVSSSGSVYKTGEEVEVIFLPDNPSEAKLNSFWGFWLSTIITAVLGLSFSAVGGGMTYSYISKVRKEKRLAVAGKRVYAEIGMIDFVQEKEHSDYWVIKASWQDPKTGDHIIFESDKLFYNPQSYIKSKEVEVLIDPLNPYEYMMDTSFLPKSA